MTTPHTTRVLWDEESLHYRVTCELCGWSTVGRTYDEVKPAAEAHEQAECRPPDDGRTGAAPDEP